ncbi:MAG: RIP metalloprotease RseP [Alphaproteobacteria bacterium]|nr:MAG: RIP metalloprotease RseP [Alphaproteobacteria bacterium]
MDIVSLIPSFGGLVWTVLAFVVALSVIIAVHEYGHYIVGRWSGIRPEVFSIGFGPVLWSRVDRRGTRWQIAALPFGGYVKFLGDSNAASAPDGETIAELSPEERRHTMQGAPLWARAATVLAGPAANFVLSLVLFALVLMLRGVPVSPVTIAEIAPLPAPVQELEVGDAVLAVEGEETPDVETFVTVIDRLPVKQVLDYHILRNDAERDVRGPYPYPPLVGGVTPDSAAEAAGLRPGDVILSIDGREVIAFREMREIVGSSGGKPLLLKVWREGEVFDVTLVPRRTDLPLPDGSFETRWLIGITGGLFFSPATEPPSLWEAAGYGASQTWFIVKSSLSGLYHMAAGAISSCNLRGPIGIAETSGAAAAQGGLAFIWFIAVLSTAVGLLNLFPVPVLDGGHLVFHAWEAITGRPPAESVVRILMTAGLMILLALMAFALTNDLFCP